MQNININMPCKNLKEFRELREMAEYMDKHPDEVKALMRLQLKQARLMLEFIETIEEEERIINLKKDKGDSL